MAVSNDVAVQECERRRYGRIDDEILMFWREVDPDEIPEDNGNGKHPPEDSTLALRMKLLSLETAELLKRVGRSNPALAEYLTVLEQKVDTLASAVIAKDNFAQFQSTRHVNLSASGLAFLTDKEYHLGTLFELKMVFSPTLTSIIAYGRVIYCIHYDDDKPLSHRIGVGFIRLHDYDREKLVGHVNNHQSQRKGN